MPPSSDSVALDEPLLRRWPLPAPEGGDKNARGTILVLAGSPQVPGAAMLSGTAALRAGAGKLQIATCSSIALQIGIAVPESLVVALEETDDGAIAVRAADALARYAARASALTIGPGLADESATVAFVGAVVARLERPVVLDATALRCCVERPGALAHLSGRVVLTPHSGEMATLRRCSREEVEIDPARCASDAAREFGAIVALKGATTFIAEPDGALYRNDHGDEGLATSGSGDVLAGLIGGLLARGAPPLQAACWGVYLHAQAGAALSRRVGLGFLARELPGRIPRLVRSLTTE